MLVLLVAAWAAAQSFRGNKSFFTPAQRRMIWFWLGIMLVSLLLMFGRYAPFYQFFYALPYASTIRNPAKFLHVLEWVLLIVFAYGIHGLATLYLDPAAAVGRNLASHVSAWWKRVVGFDRRWVKASFAAVAVAGLAWLVFYAMRGRLEAHLSDLNQIQQASSGQQADLSAADAAAQATVRFSLRQAGWAVGFMALTTGLLALVTSGYFNGPRTRAAGVLLGLLLIVDLGWQNRPYVVIVNWKEKYVEAGDNPVIQFLRQDAYEHRVAGLPRWLVQAFRADPRIAQAEGMFQQVYGIEWTQHLFQYYNIQTLDVVQMPRRPVEYEAFEQALQFTFSSNTLHVVARRWQLTNTRYLLGTAPLVEVLNQVFDPGQKRFEMRMLFEFYQDWAGGPILTRTNTTGPFALIEFTGALPRAKLFTNWQVVHYDPEAVASWLDEVRRAYPPDYPITLNTNSIPANDLATLAILVRKSFDPAQTVLLAEPVNLPPSTNTAPGRVEFVSYAPKHIVLKAESEGPAVLLLNDRYDPNWQVFVDGRRADLLRCNYVMRGVAVPAGEHRIEFHFRPPLQAFYVSLAAVALGIGLLAFLCLGRQREPR
jgi:hypothetical protein